MQIAVIPWSGEGPPGAEDLRRRLENEGFEVFAWEDGAGARYAAHSHDHDESIWCVSGTITFGIGGRDYALAPGDRLMLPRGTVHTARVDARGAQYLIGQLS